jgi:hypothetical protein
MEKLLKFEEIPEHFANETTLIHAFWEGSIFGYDKDTLEPINGKNIIKFFNEMAEIFKSPEVYLIENKAPVHADKKTGIFYKYEGDIEEEREHLLEFYRRLRNLPELAKKDKEFYDYFKEGYPVYSGDIYDIIKGFGIKEGKEIISRLLFKETELRNVFLYESRKKLIPEGTAKIIQNLIENSSKQTATAPTQEKKATEALNIVGIRKIFPSITDRQAAGFEDFKKGLAKNFKTATRAAVAVLAYCHQEKKRLTRDELQDLFDWPENFPGAEAFKKYRGRLSKELIQDIYAELPPEYRHERGQKKKDRQTSETS